MGVVSLVIGVLILVWPAPSTVVLALLFAIQMCIGGALQLVVEAAVRVNFDFCGPDMRLSTSSTTGIRSSART